MSTQLEQLVEVIKQRLREAERAAVRSSHLVAALEIENRALRDQLQQAEIANSDRSIFQLRIEP